MIRGSVRRRSTGGGLVVGRDLRVEPALAVIVQCMVDSDRSGVMFTIDPSTGDTSLTRNRTTWWPGFQEAAGGIERGVMAQAREDIRDDAVRAVPQVHRDRFDD